MLKNRQNYEIITPETIGLKEVQLNLTSRSGRAAVKHRMQEMGYQESDYSLDELYDAFLKLADKKGQVFDYDLGSAGVYQQSAGAVGAFSPGLFQRSVQLRRYRHRPGETGLR